MNAHFSPDSLEFLNEFSVDVDNWFVYERLSSHLDFFVLWGISGGAKVCHSSEYYSAGTGARFGGGLSFMFFRRSLELALQAVWNPYFAIEKDDGDFGIFGRPLNFPLSAAVRFWF